MEQVLSIIQNRLFISEEECLAVLFELKHQTMNGCPKCLADTRFYPVKGRRCYECGSCGYQVYPMKGTMMEGSRTPLLIWFSIIKDFCNDHRGISAHSISKKYKLTYKTAWRICHQIRKDMGKTLSGKLSGTVEIDESYIGGKHKLQPGTENKGIGDKQIVFGMLERKKSLRMVHVVKKNAATIRPLIKQYVEKGTVLHHDNNGTYGNLVKAGYQPKLVSNKVGKEFRRGIHNNNIEANWSRLKKHIFGTYVWVSPKYLQAYLDEFSYRYNLSKKAKG